MEQCRESRFVVVTFSGTGMESSHYQANAIRKVVEDVGGCVMYHWYGHSYDAQASAQSVENAISNVALAGKPKPVVFLAVNTSAGTSTHSPQTAPAFLAVRTPRPGTVNA